MIRYLTLTVFFVLDLSARQVALQPWTEVYGKVQGQGLGGYVTGIKPTVNLPYRAAVSHGGSTSFYRLQTPTDTSAQLTITGTGLLLGDLNNDGYTDAVVVRETLCYPGGYTCDTVYIYWGNSVGLDTLNPLLIPNENPSDGLRPGCIGDINNDGKEDLILTADNYPQESAKGKVYIYLNPVTSATPNDTIVGDSRFSFLGTNCAIADLNNDGFNDLIVKGNNEAGPQSTWFDYVNCYWGVGHDSLNLKKGFQFRGYPLYSWGLACFDVNGDGIADLLWTNYDSSNFVSVHYGGPNIDSIPNLKLRNPGVGNFGWPIINGGDMNGDGYDDIVVSAYDATSTSGFIFVFAGGPKIDSYFDAAVGMSSDSYFGSNTSSVGDINGDGLADIIIGAPQYDFETSKGYWGIFKGDTAIHVTDVKEQAGLPSVFRLYQCYPNPLNPNTTIKYDLRESATITLEVFNPIGQKISTLVNMRQQPGTHEAMFDGSRMATGVYFYTLTARTMNGSIHSDTKKLLLMK